MVISCHFSYMAFPTIVFATNSDFVKAAPKTCRWRNGFFPLSPFSQRAIFTAGLFAFNTAFIVARDHTVLAHRYMFATDGRILSFPFPYPTRHRPIVHLRSHSVHKFPKNRFVIVQVLPFGHLCTASKKSINHGKTKQL